MLNIIKFLNRVSKILYIIIIFSLCIGVNKVYSVERDPNSSKGFATFDDQAAAEDARRTIENDVAHQNVTNNTNNKSNNNYLASLQIEGYKLVPDFSKEIMEYYLDKEINSDTININAVPDDSKATVIGTGKIKVNFEDESCRVEVTAESGTVRTYVIHLKTYEDVQKITDVNGKNISESNKTYLNILLAIILFLIIILVFVVIFIKKKKGKIKNENMQ